MAMTGAGLTAARQAAKNAVITAYQALAPLNPAQQAQLGVDMLAADSDAIVTYWQGNGAASFTAAAVGVGMVAGPNPVTGTLTVTGGVIL